MRDDECEPTFAGTERFRVERRLGRGGMGVVYLVRDEERGAEVALKVLSDHVGGAAVEQLKREFRTLADVSHPNLVALYELIVEADQCFFTMEHVDGVELIDWISGNELDRSHSSLGAWRSRRGSSAPHAIEADATVPGGGPLRPSAPNDARAARPSVAVELSPTRADPARLREALRQLAEALVALHAAHRLHLDLKPPNVLVRKDGRVVVLDFGIARSVDDEDDLGSEDDADIAGTPAYMAPEQATGGAVGPAADWYAVGTMLFVALTGRLPFEGSTASLLLAKHMRTPPRVSSLVTGVDPELDALVSRLLAADPDARATGTDVLSWCGASGATPSQPPPSVRPPFVGRATQLDRLTRALDDVRSGKPVVVWAGGRSGMGKTTLVRQFLSNARKRSSCLVLSSRCYERESVAFKAFDGIADALARHLRELPSSEARALLSNEAHALARVFPVLSKVRALEALPRRSRDIVDPQELRRSAFLALKGLLRAIAAGRPLVLFVDDLQWSDTDSAALLAEILSGVDTPPMLFVGAYRDDELATNEQLREVLDAPDTSVVDVRALDVGPLDPDEAADLACRLAGGVEPLRAVELAELARESRGNPLFVAELVRYAANRASDADTPASLDALLSTRVQSLDAQSRTMLELVALAGVPVAQSVVLRAGASLESVDLGSTLVTLRGANLVRTRGGRPADPVECYHDRVRETVATQIDDTRRRTLSGHLADELERLPDADPEMLAHQWRQAGQPHRAAAHVERAADLASSSLAFERAARLYAEAIQLGPRDVEHRDSLHGRLADALASVGRASDAARHYLLAAGNRRTREALELRRLAAEHYLTIGEVAAGTKVLDDLLETVDLPVFSGPTHAAGWLLWQRARNAIRGTSWKERAEADIPIDDLLRVDVCLTAAFGYTVLEPIRGVAYGSMHLGLALDAGEARRVALALAVEAGQQAITGVESQARVRELLTRASSIAERLADPFPRAFVALVEAIAAWGLGRWRDGAEHAERSGTLLRETCTNVFQHIDRTNEFGLVCGWALGDLSTTRSRVTTSLQLADERKRHFASSGLRLIGGVHALLQLARDEHDAAEREVERAIASWTHPGFHMHHHHALLASAYVDLYRGDGERAMTRFTRAWRALDRSLGLRVEPLRVQTLAVRAAAALSASQSARDPRGYLRTARKDARSIRSVEHTWARAEADLIDAQLAALAGEHDAARRFLESALHGFARAEMPVYQAILSRALGTQMGGDAGVAMRAEGDAALEQRGIVRPDVFSRVFAPVLFR